MTTDTIKNHHTWGIVVLEMKLSIIQVNIPIMNISVDMNIIDLVMYMAQLLIADQVMINMNIIINIVMYAGIQVTDTVIKVAAVNEMMFLMVRKETTTDRGKKVVALNIMNMSEVLHLQEKFSMSRAYVKSHLPPLITILVQVMIRILRPCITIQGCTVVATIVMYVKSPHHLQTLITIGVQVPTVQLKWAENLVPTIMMFVNNIHPLPLLITEGSSGTISPYGESYRDVCEQYSPPPTSHHSRSSGAISPHGESYHDVHDSRSSGDDHGMYGYSRRGTGHHTVTVQWILENLQVEIYVTIHHLQVAALQVLTIVMYGTINVSILSTVV